MRSDANSDGPREELMRRALRLARRGQEHVSPNPMVGAVVVRGGRILGEGYHRRFGGAHAEVDALSRVADARGSDLYVTLEPCGHHGKTPPCALAIQRAGVARVYYGAADPNPLTAGKGPRFLRAHGIACRAGCLAEECRALNAPFFHWIRTGLPWVILKWAMTLDGKTAAASGESRWITGEAARAEAHRIRRRVDGILVGTETALHDDPLLTPRPSGGRLPARIVVDARGRLPLRLRLLRRQGDGTGEGPRIYVTSDRAGTRRLRELESRGLRVILAPRLRGGRLDLHAVLRALGAVGISQLLVEGGATLSGSFLEAGLVQEVTAFIAFRLLGGDAARPALGGSGLPDLASMPWLQAPVVQRVGEDLLVSGRVLFR